MTKRAPKQTGRTISVTHNVFTHNTPPTNEHTQRSVEALALAVQANAEAIREVASALANSGAKFGPLLNIGT